jgi:hypothetical protein
MSCNARLPVCSQQHAPQSSVVGVPDVTEYSAELCDRRVCLIVLPNALLQPIMNPEPEEERGMSIPPGRWLSGTLPLGTVRAVSI